MLKRPRRSVASPPPQTVRPPHRRRKSEKHHRDRYDWITLVTAIVGVIVVAVSTGFTAYQSFLTRDQLSNAISQQRAWLRVEVAPDSPLIIDKVGARATVQVTLKNVGTVPAFVTRRAAVMYDLNRGEKGYRVGERYLRECLEDGGMQIDGGEVVFPGEDVLVPLGGLIAPRVDFTTPEPTVTFLLAFCVDYRVPGSDAIHHSVVNYTIAEQQPDGGLRLEFARSGDRVPQERIVLRRVGGGERAD